MMCAIEAGKRGRSVIVIDHARAPGEKIRISGGGRCNFTNIHAAPRNFLSENPRFCISALRRFTPADFIAMVEAHRIAYHEKTLGQLFCDDKATAIIDMLTTLMRDNNVRLSLGTSVQKVTQTDAGYAIQADGMHVTCSSLVIATGGKSIPKMGATGFGYDIARQFGLRLTETRPALVPLTFDPTLLATIKPLAGVSVEAIVSCNKTRFREAMLFTHRGLSGPAILQISSYWREGDAITINMAPDHDIFEILREARAENGRQALHTVLAHILPRSLAHMIAAQSGSTGNIADLSDKALRRVAESVNAWRLTPTGSEGYRTAEVTLGGVSTEALDSRTMEVKSTPGLYFIGEVVDVTGWLGGYNFQWAWASGWAAGQAV